jgi:probable HAF family extracellular repeat protein
MKTLIKTACAVTWPLAISLGLLAALNGQAGKPGGGGTTGPSYTYIPIGPPGTDARTINQSGVVAGTLETPDYTTSFVVVPEDTNNDGNPDLWFKDLNGDGVNDLLFDVGRPNGVGNTDKLSRNLVINDRVQILINWTINVGGVGKSCAVVLTPVSVNGEWVFFQDDGTGANALMQCFGVDANSSMILPIGMNNAGQIIGHKNNGQVHFVIAGLDLNSDGLADTWYLDEDADGVNDLVQCLAYDNSSDILEARAINDRGEIAGCIRRARITPSGMVWWADDNNDGVNDLVLLLPPVGVGQGAVAAGLNEAGRVVGCGSLKNKTVGIAWTVGPGSTIVTTKLPGLHSDSIQTPDAINAADVIVGWSTTTSSPASTGRAVVWQNGVAYDLGTQSDQASALVGAWMRAWDINDSGVILGLTRSGYDSYAFVAVPKR